MGRFLIFYIAFAAILIVSFSATLATTTYDVFESVEHPDGWRALPGRPDPSTLLAMRIHLKKQNTDSFEKRFLEISDPDHPSYGSFFSRDQLRVQLQPHPDAVAAVSTWLAANGVTTNVRTDFDSVRFDATVTIAEKLLRAKYQVFENLSDGRTVVRTLEYSLPRGLDEHIVLVQPTTMFGLQKMGSGAHNPRPFEEVTLEAMDSETVSQKETGDVGDAGMLRVMEASDANAPISPKRILNVSVCNKTVTPECLADLYGYAGYQTHGYGWLGISGFMNQYAQYSDLEDFLNRYRPDAERGNFSVVSVNGGKNIQNPGDPANITEANLDVQYALGIAYPINTTYYTVGGQPPYIPDLDVIVNDSEPYLEYLDYLLSRDHLPNVISTSYGENEQTVPYRYRLTVCEKFKELGARGVSIIFASGDSGPGWSCRSNDGLNRLKFLPQFPATCPWVTSVGGTVHVNPEQAVEFSSGGFSDTWAQPSYQKPTVQRYLRENRKLWQPFARYFNSRGRAFPDVAAQGDNYRVFIEGQQFLIDGTSASAPVFAGIVALLNDDRLSRGKKPLGFLNPLLYKHPEAFTDITKGRSVGCNGMAWGKPIEGNVGIIPGAGWDAVKGWDPVTGLGTPKFEELLKIGEDSVKKNGTQWHHWPSLRPGRS